MVFDVDFGSVSIVKYTNLFYLPVELQLESLPAMGIVLHTGVALTNREIFKQGQISRLENCYQTQEDFKNIFRHQHNHAIDVHMYDPEQPIYCHALGINSYRANITLESKCHERYNFVDALQNVFGKRYDTTLRTPSAERFGFIDSMMNIRKIGDILTCELIPLNPSHIVLHNTNDKRGRQNTDDGYEINKESQKKHASLENRVRIEPQFLDEFEVTKCNEAVYHYFLAPQTKTHLLRQEN